MACLHKLRTYKDGYKLVEYCSVCSAEGIDLGEDCPGNFPNPVEKSLDEKKQTVK